ncbi:rhoptry kinase family protein ROP28 [Besnoitia besnoiti]|uniref:Rhoptry kinase family protein ROP28 n=1 Tax=Besnoitia besnoiti TaxID=94643 RepID=A0A2A9M5K5_BESBE|nr:rhoptry kinase family protein ROP28 [Besnoitia besnoiti]PFH33229.1 rhoptry kinase family protein ROP28 [Besnoitia besnoiti]
MPARVSCCVATLLVIHVSFRALGSAAEPVFEQLQWMRRSPHDLPRGGRFSRYYLRGVSPQGALIGLRHRAPGVTRPAAPRPWPPRPLFNYASRPLSSTIRRSLLKAELLTPPGRPALQIPLKFQFTPSSSAPDADTEWADPHATKPVAPEVLKEGKRLIARAVQIAQLKASRPSFLALHAALPQLPGLARGIQPHGIGDPQPPNNITAVKVRAVSNMHEAPRSREAAQPLAFIEAATKQRGKWTPAIGFLNAVKTLWPSGTEAVVVDKRGVKHHIVWKKLLGVGGMGGVLLLEDNNEPSERGLKQFAGKIIYHLTAPNTPDAASVRHLRDVLKEEEDVGSLFEQAARVLPDCPSSTSDIMEFLFEKGFVLPQRIFELKSTTRVPDGGKLFEFDAETLESPGDIMRLDRYIIAYPVVGPDLDALNVRDLGRSAFSYIVYKVTHIMARMQEMKLVHLDIKAENFLARNDGELFAADLSMAVKASAYPPCFQGTMQYLDPNAAACAARDGRQPPRFKRDAYALGITFYKLICQTYPLSIGDIEREAVVWTRSDPTNRNFLRRLISGVSQLTRADWNDKRCRGADDTLWTVIKLLLDPVEETRWTALDLVKKLPFFKPVADI